MSKIKQCIVGIGLALIVFVAGGAAPAGSDRDLIIRLQGEITVLQRQIRDLQETIDRNHATSSQAVARMVENTENSGKTISTLSDRLNQTDSLQHNNLTGVVKRLAQVEENVSQSNGQLIEVNRALREIKSTLQRQAAPKPEN
jgi:uncharacterized phage infection (PIP) family protein YhgE